MFEIVTVLVVKAALDEIERTCPWLCTVCLMIFRVVTLGVLLLVGYGYYAYPGIRHLYHLCFYEAMTFVVDLIQTLLDMYSALLAALGVHVRF